MWRSIEGVLFKTFDVKVQVQNVPGLWSQTFWKVLLLLWNVTLFGNERQVSRWLTFEAKVTIFLIFYWVWVRWSSTGNSVVWRQISGTSCTWNLTPTSWEILFFLWDVSFRSICTPLRHFSFRVFSFNFYANIMNTVEIAKYFFQFVLLLIRSRKSLWRMNQVLEVLLKQIRDGRKSGPSKNAWHQSSDTKYYLDFDVNIIRK